MPTSLPLPADSLDLIPVPTLVLAADGVVTGANDRAAELLKRDDLVGVAFMSLVHPEHTGTVDLAEADGGGLRLQHADCSPCFVRLFARPVEGGGTLVCLTPSPSDEVVYDISGGMIDATLLARAVHAANNSIVVADVTQPNQPLVFVNQGFLSLTGYTSDEIVGRNCRFLQTPHGGTLDDDVLEERLRQERDNRGRSPADVIRSAIEARETVDGIVIRNYTADGTAFWNELYLTPVDNGDGVTHYVGVQNDVTERVEAQRRLKRQASKLEDILHSLDVPIGLLEAYDGGAIRHVFANALAVSAFDLSDGVEVGLDGLGFRGDARADWVDAVHRADATGNPVRFTTLRTDGQTYEVTVSPVRDGEPRPDVPSRYLYLARNNTDGIQLERDVLQISARELSRVAQDIHDGVGQTLVGASMLSSALAAELDGSDHGVEAERLQKLVRASLKQLRQFALGLDPVDIDDLGIDYALERLTGDVAALFGIDVTCEIEPGRCDLAPEAALDVYRIVQEALTNAVRHGHADHITVAFRCDERVIEVIVTDDGDGIDTAAVGTHGGMGLRTMRGRARRLGGRLEIQNTPSGGTIVRVRAKRLSPFEA